MKRDFSNGLAGFAIAAFVYGDYSVTILAMLLAFYLELRK